MNATNSRSANFNRVIVVGNQSIMGAGMEELLSSEPFFEVVGTSTNSETALVQIISRLQPDIIVSILESKGPTPTRLLELLFDYGSLRIVLVSMESNVLEVYEKKQIITNEWTTLMGQIKPEQDAT